MNQRDEAQKKLNRASQLMSSIGSEKDRWIQTKAKLGEDKQSLLGDMIIVTAFITYLGPFEGKYRNQILREKWQPLVGKYKIKHSPDFSLKNIIGDEEVIANWTIQGLPNENVSFENMIIMQETRATNFPVIIDPQG
jgi:dynein heavy chain, axonemal